MNSPGSRGMQQAQATVAEAPRLMSNWPVPVQRVAQEMMGRYGLPHEVTDTHAVWRDHEPWKTIVIWREGTWHNFPQSHLDILQQTIGYRVPLEKVQELCAFDGSVVVDRTRGELSVTSDSEAMNILTVNIAHLVVQGKLDVAEARRKLTEGAIAMRLHWPVPDCRELQFTTTRDYEFQRTTADPDTVTIGQSLFGNVKKLFE